MSDPGTYELRDMRILHVSDFHFRRGWFDWLVDEAPRADLICFSGDFLDMGSSINLDEQVEWVQEWLRNFPRRLAFCSGNHDLLPNLRIQPAFVLTEWLRGIENPNLNGDGSDFQFGGFRILCREFMNSVPGLSGERTILLSHEGPAEAKVARDDAGDWGDYELLEALKKGKNSALILCGHVHEPLSWHSRIRGVDILNTGANLRASIPNHHIIDLEKRSVARFAKGEYSLSRLV